MFCTRCGFEIKDGYKFCPKCGAPAYVEQEEPNSEAKEDNEIIADEEKNSIDDENKAGKKEKAKKEEDATNKSNSNKKGSDYASHEEIISILSVEKELDIEGVKKRAGKGDKSAMLRQAFRYEIGIGVEKNLEKAEDLYNKAGGKNSLFELENSHSNCILPDSYYGYLVLENVDKKYDGFYFKTLPFVKDILVDYADKVNKAKFKGEVSEEELKRYQNEFIINILNLRDRYPELLSVNFDNYITDEIATHLFDVIKKNASNRYSLSWLPSLFYFSDYVDGNRIEIPNIFFLDDKKYMLLLPENEDESTNNVFSSFIQQIIFNIILQLPVKKIHFTFICKSYEKVGLLFNSLDSTLYDIVCSEEEYDSLLKKFEKRKRAIIKKYGIYQDYCEKNRNIPLPYEFVFNIDSCFNVESDMTFGKNVGLYFFDVRNEKLRVFYYKNQILNKKKSEIATENPVLYPKYQVCEKLCWDVYNWSSQMLPPGYSLASILIHDDTMDLGLTESTNRNGHIAEGEGEYEVALQIGQFPECEFVELYGTLELTINFDIDLKKIRYSGDRIVLKCFQTGKEALEYVEEGKLRGIKPIIMKPVSQRIRLIPYYGGNQKDILKIGLYVPAYVSLNDAYIKDMQTYFAYIGFNQNDSDRLIRWISNKKNIINESDFHYNTIVYKNNHIYLVNNDYRLGDGYYFPEFMIYEYKIETNFLGQLKNYDEILAKCKKDIGSIEKELVDFAKKEWGPNYYYDHLFFSDEPQDICRFDIRKVKHYKIPIMGYRQSDNEGIIRWTPITENETLLKACIDYINTEARAKEEMEVQHFDFSSASESEYEGALAEMIIPVGKAETKEADFRMDLVSHVHSFIIGQSGSGKSVFLHNIIGGAMLKYAPEDLQLYLLDFKLGGVEFNRYQGAKHVKALLVDNSDSQVTLEILRELRGSMTERGKLLRNAGVNNIGEYNKIHQQDRMPHVLVVADECHEMFKADDSIPRQVRNEISDIVIKIAKEGRSQGVHLVFATQTLSGTEISSEIINNVSDFYLLKCAQTDSERLVPNSSTITSELSTGQIYYHHVDEQVKFQAYYTDKEAAEKLMAAIVEKAKDHRSNGEFYFNGAQMFYLDEIVKEQMQEVKGKSPVAFMGKAIDISQKDLYIKLNEDFSENVLLLGLNDQEQVTRTTMNLFVSLMMSAKLKHKNIAFKVIDCLNNEEGEVHELIFDLENEGYCEIIERRQRSRFFKELAQSVQNGTAEETILLILGQDRFRELKMDMELEESISSKSSDDEDMNILSDNLFGDSSSSSTSVRTYRDALNVILEKGPDYGVHTLLQIEKASNLLFEDYITPKVVFQKFKHLVMLKSDETAGVTLHLNDDIRLEKLSSDWERLRAYYYAEESDSYTLFTPYMPSKSKDIINLLKSL